MAEEYGPLVRRKLLGMDLRRLREEAGISREDAASYVGVQPPTLSRIELGKQAIRPANVKLLLQLYEVPSPMSDALLRMARESNERGWWTAYSETIPDWFKAFVGLENDADEISAWSSELVDGLLQTPDYIKAIALASRPDSSEEELQRSVDLRQARQARLTGDHPPKRYRVVLNEAVVRRPVGGSEVMKAQLAHLLEMGDLPFVSIQVLPFAVGAHPAMISSFVLIRFAHELKMNAVYLENERGGVIQERRVDLARFTDVFERLTTLALSPDETKKLVASLMKDL